MAKNARWSMTGIKAMFMPPFDADFVIEQMFKRSGCTGPVYHSKKGGNEHDGKTRFEIKQYWQSKTHKGTDWHYCIEKYLANSDINRNFTLSHSERRKLLLAPDGPSGRIHSENAKYVQSFLVMEDMMRAEGWEIFRVELVVYIGSVCGTIDALYRRFDHKKKKYVFRIVDWKTVSKPVDSVYYPNKCYAPFEHMPNSKRSGFTLQLNGYALALSKFDMEIVSIMAACFFEDGTLKFLPLEMIDVSSMFSMWEATCELLDKFKAWHCSNYAFQVEGLPLYLQPFGHVERTDTLDFY